MDERLCSIIVGRLSGTVSAPKSGIVQGYSKEEVFFVECFIYVFFGASTFLDFGLSLDHVNSIDRAAVKNKAILAQNGICKR